MRGAAPPAVLLLTLCRASCVYAQSETPAPPPVFYETTTVTARPVAEAVVAVAVIDAHEIEASAARSATDLLQQLPGVEALSSGARGGVTNAFLRGSDPNYTLVLLDGIPLNDSTELQGGAVNLEELPATLVDHLEVVRGPLAAFYGTNALAGVVQLFTPRGGPGPVRATLGAEAGDARLRRAFGRVSGANANGGQAAGVSWDEETHRIASDSFRQLDLFANTDRRFGASAALALVGRFADGSAEDYPDASGGPVYGSGLLRHSEHRDLALGARLEEGSDPARRQQWSLALARRELDRTSPAVPPLVPESREKTAFTRLRLAWQLPLVRSSRTTVDAGASAEAEWGENTSVLKLPASLGGDTPGDYRRTRTTAGAYGGLRHQRGAWLAEAALRVDATSDGQGQASPHAGLVFRPGQGTTRLHASFGRAAKQPSFFALASPPALGGNPALKPEHAWGGEAGVQSRVEALRLELGATYFRQQLADLVDFDFQRFLHVNRARVRTQGVELAARWQPHPTLAFDAQTTYLDVLDLATGGTLLHTPKWTGGLRLTWQPRDGLSLRLHARTSARSLDVQYPVPQRDSVDGYSLLGCAGSWRVGRGLSLRARADNLLDASYETLIGFPGPRRSFWAGVGWQR